MSEKGTIQYATYEAVYCTSEDFPPSFDGVDYWERGKDPIHPDAFARVLTVVDRIFRFGFKKTFSRRKSGWLGINQENVEAWVPDGTEYTISKPLEIYWFTNHLGKMCARPKSN